MKEVLTSSPQVCAIFPILLNVSIFDEYSFKVSSDGSSNSLSLSDDFAGGFHAVFLVPLIVAARPVVTGAAGDDVVALIPLTDDGGAVVPEGEGCSDGWAALF